MEGVFGEDQYGFRRRKGTNTVTEILKIISERTLDVDEELYACFIDRPQAFDRVKWTKLIQSSKGCGIDWRYRRSISKLCMDQSVNARLDQGEIRSVKIER